LDYAVDSMEEFEAYGKKMKRARVFANDFQYYGVRMLLTKTVIDPENVFRLLQGSMAQVELLIFDSEEEQNDFEIGKEIFPTKSYKPVRINPKY